MVRIILLLLVISASDAFGASINIDLTKKNIDITNNFKGTEISLYGTKNAPGDIVVLIRGPKLKYVVRKKEQYTGLWIGSTQLKFTDSYSYYYVASDKEFKKIANHNFLRHLEIGFGNIYLKCKSETDSSVVDEFKKQFIAHQQHQGLYLSNEKGVRFINDKLFRVNIPIPYNVSPGIYIVETYLINNGELVTMEATPFHINRTGLNGFIYKIAYRQPLIYGLISILIPLVAGIMVSMIFNRKSI